jgi:release factor glutamine methyltransferase
MANPTIAEALDSAAKHLERQGVSEGRRTAQLLMMHLLEIEQAELLSRGGEELTPDLQAQFSGLLSRRVRHEPVQYITRRVEFWSHRFYIDPRALIPRPETEHIIEEVLRDYTEKEAGLLIVDVGVGSGVLATVLATEFPKSKVFGVDLAQGALEVAGINVMRLNVGGRVELLHGDLLAPVGEKVGPDSVDMIVSNPPYISIGEAASLAPEVVKAEPKGALIAGPTGLEVFERLIPQVALMLAPGGKAYLECGAGQAGSVVDIVTAQENLRHLRTAKDLQGIERVVVAERIK